MTFNVLNKKIDSSTACFHGFWYGFNATFLPAVIIKDPTLEAPPPYRTKPQMPESPTNQGVAHEGVKSWLDGFTNPAGFEKTSGCLGREHPYYGCFRK